MWAPLRVDSWEDNRIGTNPNKFYSLFILSIGELLGLRMLPTDWLCENEPNL